MSQVVDVVRNNNVAKLLFAKEGKLFYQVETPDYFYKFTINMTDANRQSVINQEFPTEIKAIYLMKWIKESVKDDTFEAICKKPELV